MLTTVQRQRINAKGYEIFLNKKDRGEKVVLSPGWSPYRDSQSGTTMVLIQLLLPASGAAANDGQAPLAETRSELANKFAGLTAYVRSPAKGLWTAPDGHTEQDEVVMFEVVTDTFDRAWWRAYAATLAERFRQDTIHVRAVPVDMLDDEAG